MYCLSIMILSVGIVAVIGTIDEILCHPQKLEDWMERRLTKSDHPSMIQVCRAFLLVKSQDCTRSRPIDYDPFDFLAINALTLFKELSLAWMSLLALATSKPL